MCSVTRLIGKWLGRKRRHEAVLARDRAHRVAVTDMIVGGAQGRSMTNGQFLLPVTQFGMDPVTGMPCASRAATMSSITSTDDSQPTELKHRLSSAGT